MNYEELVKALRGKFIAYDVTGNHNSAQLYKDAADAIERLIADRDEAKTDLAAVGRAYIRDIEKHEPKRGEWKPFDLTYGRSIYSCSVCEQATEVPMCMEKPMYAYCPNCGAKMEVQE